MNSYEIELYKNIPERIEEQYWQNVEFINTSFSEYWQNVCFILLCMVLFSFISSFIVYWLTYDK